MERGKRKEQLNNDDLFVKYLWEAIKAIAKLNEFKSDNNFDIEQILRLTSESLEAQKIMLFTMKDIVNALIKIEYACNQNKAQ